MNNKRGQQAQSPTELPFIAWWDILRRTIKHMSEDNLSLIAAGVAFYFLLAIFPMLTALISVYGLLVSPQDLQGHLSHLIGVIPEQSRDILQTQVERMISKSETTLGFGAILSTSFAVWSASKGTQAMLTASNITYGERPTASFFKKILMRFTLTVCAILVMTLALFSIAVLPMLLNSLGLQAYSSGIMKWLTWPILAIVFNLSLAAFYRYGPHRKNAKWRWVTPGSVLASCIWILFSGSFSYYLTSFASYDETYGSVGSVVILLMWFYITAFIVLLGSEFNAAMEHQTLQDSTQGPAHKMGERGARVADTVPEDLKAKIK